MKPALATLFAIALQGTASAVTERIVTLGDSLTFAYEAEFGFEVTIPFDDTYGDGFGPEVRNWIEILNDPAYRGSRFDIGMRDSVSVSVFGFQFNQFFRHEYNWAIPGLKIDELRQYIDRQISLTSLLDDELATIIELSDFDEAADFSVIDLEDQIRNSAQRLTLFIGGNDVRGVYGDIYHDNAPGTFVEDFVDDATAILDWVQSLNPAIQIVIVNVPHIGVTPDVKSVWPPEPVKTGRITTVLRDLNSRLAALADAKGVGYADIFSPILPMLGSEPFAIHGIPFANAGSTTGDLDFVWLNGPISANFHPNTNIQAVIANEIIAAFNKRYDTGIALLSATEILGGLHGKTPAQIDMPFANWMAAFGKAGLPASDDSDGDGIPAGIEFGLGLNPAYQDSGRLTTRIVGNELVLAYPTRLPASTRYSLTPTSSASPASPFIPFSTLPVADPDGLLRARLPLGAGPGFMRLEATVP